MERPDLSQVDPAVKAYIEALESELEHLSEGKEKEERDEPPLQLSEPPTPLNMITISAGGLTKRTPRHFYLRQRRGGMGIFDIDLPEEDHPDILAVAADNKKLLVVSSNARAFHMSVDSLPESQVRDKGEPIADILPFQPDEKAAVALPLQATGYMILVTEKGYVRRYRHHFFGEHMVPGKTLYNLVELGSPVVGCWSSSGKGDVFIATRQGRAIRFAEEKIPTRECLGIRLKKGDEVAGVTVVGEDGGVFLLNAEGQGIVRLMSGFRANKAPGSGGKIAMRTEHLVGATAVDDNDDIFVISHSSKIIRFQATEVSTTEGVVQGIQCMNLRNDRPAVVISSAKITH